MQRKKGEECREGKVSAMAQDCSFNTLEERACWSCRGYFHGRRGKLREDNSTYLLGKNKEELDAVTGKSPLCYGSHARENKKEPFWSSRSSE